ncbi:hypothetical protein BVRB_5g105010 isoform A [Beta vulgaris subsp. vulgaris]|nr:hypothetical protein BVRB_5g105010 isoform A [Beta vulgaris subsp. vulgaris]
MADARCEKRCDDVDFSWGSKEGRRHTIGTKEGVAERDMQFYESFTYEGVEYHLYDSVYLSGGTEVEPYIGKLIQIYELPNKAREVKVLWFFHPSEISNYLRSGNVLKNEIFLATGCGKGLANVNPLEAISGKCNVLCISKDHRNRQPSIEEFKTADYVFYRTFDVQYHTVSDMLGEKIATIDVKCLLNKNDILLSDPAKVDSGNLALSIENRPTSVNGSLISNKAVENDVLIGSLKMNDDQATKNVLDKSIFHPPENHDDARHDDTGTMEDTGNKSDFNKDILRGHKYVLYDAGVGSSLMKNDKGSKVKDGAFGHDCTCSVALCATQAVSGSGQKTRVTSTDHKQNEVDKFTTCDVNLRPSQSSAFTKSKLGEFINLLDEKANSHGMTLVGIGKLNGNGSIVSASDLDKRKKELGKRIHVETGTVQKLKSANDYSALEEQPSKKLKIDGVAPSLRDNGGICTHKYATNSAANNKTSQSACLAARTNDKGKSGKQLVGTSNGIAGMLESNGIDEHKGMTQIDQDDHIGTNVVQKLKSVDDSGSLKDRRSKNLKHYGTAPLSSNDGGISTHKSATVSAANYRASRPAGAATVTNGKNKSGNHVPGTSNVFVNKSKLSTPPSKDLEKYDITQTTSKVAPQLSGIVVDTSDRSKLDRGTSDRSKLDRGTSDRSKLDRGTSDGIPNKHKFDGAIKGKSVDKMCKPTTLQTKDMQKLGVASNTSNNALSRVDVENSNGARLSKGSSLTKDRPSHLKSNAMVEVKSNDKLQRGSVEQCRDTQTQDYGRLREVTQRPPDKSRWMRAGCVPWEERMKEAHDQGTLVLLQNLDPTYTSLEVENIVWCGFGYHCTAKITPHTATSSPHSGQAFAIFKTQVIANKVIGKLGEECLMLPNGRPLVGSSWVLRFPGKQSSFPGHLVFDKVRQQTQRDLREAVSTSHSSQPNTLEYEMALDWGVLQERSDKWWNKLHQIQIEEIEKLKARLKPN